MARSFNGTSDNIQIPALNLSGDTQLTVSFWLNWTAFANDDKLACEFTANYGLNAGAFICDPDSSGPSAGKAYFGINGSPSPRITTAEFNRPSAGVWHNWIVLLDGTATGAAAIPKVYIDGVSQSLTQTNTAYVATSFANSALNLMCRNAASLFGAGSMADFAIWGNVLLTQGEVTGLASGARPYQIRPASLQHWEPIDGLQSPEPDLSHFKNNGTVTGTALAAGPPIMPLTPRWPRFNGFVGWTPLLPASGLGWIINRRNKLMVPKKRA